MSHHVRGKANEVSVTDVYLVSDRFIECGDHVFDSFGFTEVGQAQNLTPDPVVDIII